jgi:hypothetical protein
MIQAEIGRDGLEPSSGGRAFTQFGKSLVGSEENLLGHILRVGWVGEQTHSGAKHHVLVVLHERLELLRICHQVTATAQGLSYDRYAVECKILARSQ